MIRAITLACCLSSFSAWAVCDVANPTNPENDCDNDGCTVGQGDCGDNDTQIKGAGCPGGARAEVCDGKDNNCAGGVDEGDPGGGGACTTGLQGVCSAGTNHCTGGAIHCAQNTQSSAEMCDGLDNNCNGSVDEGNPGGGGSCSTGQQGVCSAGTRTCTSGSLVCARNTNPSAEICDGLDNDCNGAVDNGFNVGMSCSSSNVGVCQPGTIQCQANHTAACVSTITPGSQSETCNGLDDNCNGSVDENNPGGGGSCSTGQAGICAAGTRTCSGGSLTCARTNNPTTETCNGQDDDCDGTVDNGFNVGQACATGLQGICAMGHRACQANGTAACVPDTQPNTVAETCNGLDDNCNGSVDENNPGGGASCTVSGQQGVCRNGTRVCTAGALVCTQTTNPSTEICDGLDNNCNGTTDEGFNVGQACTAAGQGRCSMGTLQCNAGGTTCVGLTAIAETCNGVDDNCNGQTDENNPGGGGSCSTGQQGVCAAGTRTCTGGALTCAQNVMASAEVCDGADNNCNGQTDEGFNVGGSCNVSGGVGRCATGTLACNTGGGTQCNGNQPVAETCNGVDDNCNGTVDENNPGGGGACTVAGQQGACRTGTRTCTSGSLQCAQTTFPTTETCNNVDDDCNGTVDDGFGVGTACTGSGQGVCHNGTRVCQGGAAVCQTPSPTTETCNGLDDNCNGQTDENDPGGGASCTTGLMGACSAGTRHCQSGSVQCVANVGSTTEICDNIDNDCNGVVDDGFDLDGDGVKSCAGCGNFAGCDCDDTNPNVKPGRSEICDALDNNCNGQVDEGTGAGGKISRNCYSGPNGTQGVGVCTAGVQACDATTPGTAHYGACTNEVTPGTETCNNKDDDCDGTVDNGFDQDNDGFRSCSACNLTSNCDCNDNDATIKPGAVELCDAIDQNCNGQLDDVPTRKCFAGPFVTPDTYSGTCPGPQCAPKGACMTGTQACSAQGAWGACNGAVLPTNDPSQPETVCNDIDDDCDGTVDDGNFDMDMDGVRSCRGDCDDTDPTVKPGAPEICDNKDNDCDGTIDGVATSCYSGPPDTRGKGLCRDGTQTCVNGMGTGTCVGEVLPALLPDGGTPLFVPDGGANEPELLCDGKDEDCDGIVDDGFDLDGDGVTTCAGDCDDADRFNHPGATEQCDCQDNNCNSQIDEGGVCTGAPCHDFDGDGITNCQGDCNDTLGAGGAIGPQFTEKVGNGIDDDCDGAIDEDTDEDGDGYSTGQGDCNDHIAAINPGAVEVCDGFDNNCTGGVDEGFDMDGDSAKVCTGDCDDADPDRSPFKPEICGNMIDDNCDGRVDEDTDADMDGVTTCQGDCNDFNAAVHPAYGSVAAADEVCDGQNNACDGDKVADYPFDLDHDFEASCFGDCDDSDPNVNSGHYEVPGNGKDDDCDGQIDEGTEDRDMDGFSPDCGDCNDSDPAIHPHATEVCDRVDNDCDAYIDSSPGNYSLCAVCFDADRDGVTNCDGDCNDADPSIYRGAPELCDLKDNDCDGDTDIDPATGLRVCMVDEDGGSILPDAGTGDGGALGGGAGGGTGAGGGAATGGGSGGPPVVTTGCGCSSGFDLAPVAFAALLFMGRRARRGGARLAKRATTAALLALTLVVLSGCNSALKTPPLPDAGGPTESDAGTDGGSTQDAGPFIPTAEWKCPGVYPVETVLDQVPGTQVSFAHSKVYTVTTLESAQVLAFDDASRNFSGFALRRDTPADLDPTAPNALETFAAREVSALANLTGTPLVRDTIERFTRISQDARMQRNYSAGLTLTFATATDASSARNRLVTQLSGHPAADLTDLPTLATNAPQEQLVIYLAFRLNGPDIYVTGAVSRFDDFRLNQPALGDFTNGSHLSDKSPTLNYACETIHAPPLKTDFIFVVDNSGSMREEQAALADSADALFNAFQASGIDFRIGVVTTDSDVLHGQGFTNSAAQFKSDVRVGTNGNGFEMGIEFGLRAIRRAKQPGMPAPYAIREDAGLVVVFVSDENNEGLETVTQYADDYVAENAITFGIVGPRPSGCVRVGLGSAFAGTEYIDLANATGGSTGSICNPNITEVVEEILFGAIGASSRATLSNRPISGSLNTEIGDHLVPRARELGFDYDPANNTLLFFGVLPADGSDVTAAYATFDYLG